jgi:RNA polymerase sigma factor (sigma-70 family)
MPGENSVALWLQGVKSGDPDAAQQLWQRYWSQLLALVRQKLPAHTRRTFDEEDIALSAFRCFFTALEQGRYPQLSDPDGLWNLLVVIAARKARNYLRRQAQQKRGGGTVRGESAFFSPDDLSTRGIEQVVGEEPTPAFAVQVAEECRYLLDVLEDDGLRSIAVLKMEGYTVEEMAARLQCARRTVERRLQMIRVRWSEVAAVVENGD